jgi:hypothetical protein
LATKKKTPKKKAASPKRAAEQKLVLTDEFKTILDILNTSNASVFITGKAGTGKLTL